MSFQLQPGAEGSLSESVHFPPTSSFHEHQGYHMDGRMAMAPPISSASRAPPRAPFLHDDGRGGPHYLHGGGFDRPEYDYAMRRHSCGDHLGLHSGTLIEHLLLQENQKALRMASLVQSQASGCLSGCLSCGLSEKRLRFKDSEERMMEEQRCYSRNVGEGPSRSVNLGAEAGAVEYPDGWFRQPRPRQSIGGVGERSQTRISFSEEELGRSLCQGRRISYPVSHPTISHSQASHHVQDQQLHPVGAAESSVPIYGFSDADGRVRQRWPTQRQTHSENGTEDDGWQRAPRSRVGPAMAREQDRLSLPGIATGSLPRTLVGSPHRPTGDSVRPPQSTHTTSQSLVVPENSAEPSYQDNVLQQAGTQRVVTQGPVSLTNWYIIKVQIAEVGRTLETKVAVGGWLVQSGEHVKTSPIANRLDIHKVVTEDGVEVSLEGTMDQEASTANGFAFGIVQCLSAGFPYMWKNLLRVRAVGESSSLAVSESLGGLHPKASKCLSEDESQGIIDPKTSKTVPEDMPCSSRDCEGNSPTPAVNEEPSVIQTPVNISSDVVETEVGVTERGGTPDVAEREAAVTVRAEISDAIQTEAAITARADTSSAIETEAVVTARAGTSNAIETEATVAARAGTADAIETEAVVTARAGTSNAIEIEATVAARAGTADAIETEATVAARAGTADAIETEAAVTARAGTSDGTEMDCSHQDVLLQRTQDASPTSLNSVPVTEASAEFVTTDSLAKEAESGPIIDTTLVTIRRIRKSKKGPSQAPVRSSRRLQQRQSRSSEFTLTLVGSLGPAQIEQVASAMNITADKSGVGESAEIVPDVKQAQTGREELTKTNSIIDEVLKDLQQADTEAVDQGGFPSADSMGFGADPQPMEVEESGQVQDHGEILPKDIDGVGGRKLKEDETTEDESKGMEIQETVPVAPLELENEKIDETAPVAHPELESEEIEESAPVTPPELLQSKVQSRIGSFSKPSSEGMPQASEKRAFPECSARMTRSLKRRLKLTPITETAADVAAPITRSLKRLRRLSDGEIPSAKAISKPVTPHQEEGLNVEPISNPDTNHQEEGRSVEPGSNPDTPHQEEVDAFYVRIRSKSKSRTKAVSCSPQDLLDKYNSNVVRSEVTPEQVVERVSKVERVDYEPLVSHHNAQPSGMSQQLNKDQTEPCTMKRQRDRFKGMKPANRFVKTGTSRKRIVGDSGKRSSGGLGTSSSRGKSRRTSIIPTPLPHPSVRDKSRRTSINLPSLPPPRVQDKDQRMSIIPPPLPPPRVHDKSRRTSIIPPPLPPPRVQDKSKVPEAFGLKTSRSGRLLVPALAYWRSQSIEYDKDGGIIAIFDGFQAKPADTGCFNFTPPQEKHAKMIQEKLCKAAATVKKRK